jgi:hypothetical protein
MPESMNLTAVIEQIDQKTDGDQLSLGTLVDAFEDRGYGPMLLATALIIVLPTGGIPGVPTVIALAIVLIAAQLVFGRRSPWLPKKLRNLSFKRDKFKKAAEKIKPITRRIDRVIKPRIRALSTAVAARVIGGICILLALFMPFLEVVPFADTIPSSAIALLGLGLTARDGVVTIIGLAFGAAAVGTAAYLLIG